MAASRGPAGIGTGLDEALVRAGRYLRRGVVSADLLTVQKTGGREADSFYRDRWSYDKVVRSTHGVNCTGSCSWKVYVKDGIITWESQQTDYPSVGPDRPEYEPRGCPRGASFSWYTYSPARVRYPYVRGVLLECYREAKARLAMTRCWRGPRSPWTIPVKSRAVQVRPRQGRLRPGRVVTRRPRSPPRRTCTRSNRTVRTGSPGSRRYRRCRWSATPSGRGLFR